MRFLINHPMRESNPHSWPAGHILPVRRIGDWTISRGSKIYCWLVLRSSPYSPRSEWWRIWTKISNPRRLLPAERPALCVTTRRVFLFMGITRKEPQASVHAYHSGLAELALANQNALPSRAEKKHSAFILRSQSVTSKGGQ